MSQQKIFFAVCIVSALVALAAAQSSGGCLTALQGIAGSYGQKLQGVAMSFAQEMSKNANFDVDGFMSEINKITSGYMNLANPQTSLSPKSIYDAFTALMGQQLNVFTKYIFNTGMGMSSVTAGSKALADILTLNTQTMSDLSTSCLPGSA